LYHAGAGAITPAPGTNPVAAGAAVG